MAAIVLALAAALCNAMATILQRMGVESAPPDSELKLKLIRYVLGRPIWFAGFAAMVAAFLFQAGALGDGPLTIVQPLLVTELGFLVLILRVWFGWTLGWREAVGTVSLVAGLGTFLAVSNQGGGNSLPTKTEWILVVAACVGGIFLSLLMTRFGSRPWRSAWFGAAAAISFSLSAAFIKSTTVILQHGFVHLLLHFEPYGIAAAGLAGLFFVQNAFHAGPITASQASIVILDPIASIVIGVTLFGDNLRGGVGILSVDALALMVMSFGVFVLCHSPLIVHSTAEDRLVRRAGAPGSQPGRAAEEGPSPGAAGAPN